MPARSILNAFRIPLALAFAVSALSSILATGYYRSVELQDYKITAILTLIVLGIFALSLAVSVSSALIREIRWHERQNMRIRVDSDRVQMRELLSEVQECFCFMGIIAKRTVNSDEFKIFLNRKRDSGLQVRFLLLDPRSPVFEQRAIDENESVEAWISDLKATVNRLLHYATKYNVQVEARLYPFYPTWRLMIRDADNVVVNMFLKGMRGTESSQLDIPGISSELGQAFVNHFYTTWEHSAREIADEESVI